MPNPFHSADRRRLIAQVLCAGVFASGLSASHAAEQRSWQLHEFTRLELVPREAGSEPNQHPARIPAEVLRQQLAGVQLQTAGTRVPLFAADEAAELATALSQALERAGSGDDVLLLSSARRESGLLGSPTAVTARLFVQGGALQFIVRDARFAFYDTYRGTQVVPRFGYGSRRVAGAAVLESPEAVNRRGDWLSLGVAAAPAAGSPAPVRPLDAAAPPPSQGSKDPEQRLETLKRLREKNLITEDEYQQKRKEILQQL